MLNPRCTQLVERTSMASNRQGVHQALPSQRQLCRSPGPQQTASHVSCVRPSSCRMHSTVACAAITMRSTHARSPSASSASLIQLRLQPGLVINTDRGFSALKCRASRGSSEQLKSQQPEQYRLIAPTEPTIPTSSPSSSPLWMMGLAFFGITALISTLILQQRERRQAVKESPGEDATAPAPVSAPGSYQRALAKNRQVSCV